MKTPYDRHAHLWTTNGDIMTYWDQEQHPERLPIAEREAWHRDAWDREQIELYRYAQTVVAEMPPQRPDVIWQ